MISKYIYIIIPNLISLLIQMYPKPRPGSDHPFHVNLIRRIKKNKNAFVTDYILSFNETNPFYPQLFHWFLSFFPSRIYEYKFKRIQLAIKIIEIIFLNGFLLYVDNQIGITDITYLFVNIIFNLFPFSYVLWNAKNTGVSARETGVALGFIYGYALVIFLTQDELFLLLPLFVVTLLCLLTSQMAFQYVVFTSIIVTILTGRFEIILLVLLAVLIFYLLMPKVAKNYLIGQFHHKRSMFLYTRHYFMKSRPSLYRDFVLDFWLKFKDGVGHGVKYMRGNAFIELIYGFPFLMFLLVVAIQGELNMDHPLTRNMAIVTLSSLISFVATSFRPTRILGEPQRYVEFVIPSITVLFVLNFSNQVVITGILLSVVIILVNYLLNKKLTGGYTVDKKRELLLEYLNDSEFTPNQICISNDHELLKFISGLGFQICKPDISSKMLGQSHLRRIFYNETILVLNPIELTHYTMNYPVSMIVLNTTLYDMDHFAEESLVHDFVLDKQLNNYQVYRARGL